jgi:predicted MPP superfamily phosphohydrolase
MIITIIGSMTFHKEYEKMKDELEKRGNKVIIPLQDDYYKQEKNPKLTSMQDFNKNLEKSDAILVANFEKHGKKHYIGVNSIMEIGMAFNRNKKIFLLYDIPEGYEDELKAIGCTILKGDVTKLK